MWELTLLSIIPSKVVLQCLGASAVFSSLHACFLAEEEEEEDGVLDILH